jgi:BAI1-associated protein 3
MLGIAQPMGPVNPPISPQPPTTPRVLPDVGMDSLSLDSPEKLRKHGGSFRLSFKRKGRDSGPMPAKIIKATTVKPHTLCPKWHEKFKL